MHIEIHHRDPFGTMGTPRMFGADRHAVEQAEPHGLGRLGMVPRRPHGTEGVVGRAGHHRVDRIDHRAGRTQRSLTRFRRHDRVGVDAAVAVDRHQIENLRNMGLGMHQHQMFARGFRRRVTLQGIEFGTRQDVGNRAQARGRFRVTRRRFMLDANRMEIEAGRHALGPQSFELSHTSATALPATVTRAGEGESTGENVTNGAAISLLAN